VVTDLGVYRFDDDTGEMFLASLHPGVKLRDVREASGWDVRVPDDTPITDPPTAEELRLIREDLDPEGVYSR
jgi:glutaconate CoA-transferase subunit B